MEANFEFDRREISLSQIAKEGCKVTLSVAAGCATGAVFYTVPSVVSTIAGLITPDWFIQGGIAHRERDLAVLRQLGLIVQSPEELAFISRIATVGLKFLMGGLAGVSVGTLTYDWLTKQIG